MHMDTLARLLLAEPLIDAIPEDEIRGVALRDPCHGDSWTVTGFEASGEWCLTSEYGEEKTVAHRDLTSEGWRFNLTSPATGGCLVRMLPGWWGAEWDGSRWAVTERDNGGNCLQRFRSEHLGEAVAPALAAVWGVVTTEAV